MLTVVYNAFVFNAKSYVKCYQLYLIITVIFNENSYI